MSGVVTMLSNLIGNEVSLVRRGANRKVFAITKSEGGSPMNLKAILDTPADGEDKLVETLKSAGRDDKAIAAATASFRLQKGLVDVLKGEDVVAVAKAAGIELPVEKGGGQDEEPGSGTSSQDEEPGKPMGKAKKTKKSADLDLSSLDEESRAQVETVMKSQESLVAKTASLEKLVADLVEQRDMATHVAKAAEFKHIPGYSAQQLGAVLKSASAAGGTLAGDLEKLLAQVNEVVQKSSLLASTGVAGMAPPSSAAAKFDALVAGVVQKSSDRKMTPEKAMSEVLKTAEGKALYKEYLAENPAQRARVNY